MFEEGRLTSEAEAVGKLHQCTEPWPPSGRAFFRFWYNSSQKKGVNGAMSCGRTNLVSRLPRKKKQSHL